MKPTYILFVPGTIGPSVYHEDLESARAEAKRLVNEVGAAKVMICEFVEGIESVRQVRKLRANPLKARDDSPFPAPAGWSRHPLAANEPAQPVSSGLDKPLRRLALRNF